MTREKMKVENTKKNEKQCICGGCPSYPETGEMLFCARGKSIKAISRKGCLCPACQVYTDYELSDDFYCAGVAT